MTTRPTEPTEPTEPGDPTGAPRRVAAVLPTWLGDALMATPALGLLRERLPGAEIIAVGPGLAVSITAGLRTDAGEPVFDRALIAKPRGVLGPVGVAAALRRAGRFDAALLLPNSFSWALAARLAGVPDRVGYARDGRRPLLTRPLAAPRTPSGAWALVPAVSYYWHAASCLLEPGREPALAAPPLEASDRVATALPPGRFLRIDASRARAEAADAVLATLGLAGAPFAVLNPGGNNPAKRWPADRFAALADHLAGAHGLSVLLNGSPGEAGLCRDIAGAARTGPAVLPDAPGSGLDALVGLLARARLLVTNDTGPRHLAAAVGCPVVSLFGPTDPRWTTIPVRDTPAGRPGETILVADPTLPPGESANNHPDRCAIDRIDAARVTRAVDEMLGL